jgi:hypothetical protein
LDGRPQRPRRLSSKAQAGVAFERHYPNTITISFFSSYAILHGYSTGEQPCLCSTCADNLGGAAGGLMGLLPAPSPPSSLPSLAAANTNTTTRTTTPGLYRTGYHRLEDGDRYVLCK